MLPIRHPAWRNVGRIFADPTQSIGNRIGAMAWAADIIVHEWMHLCIDIPAPEDNFTCFPLQGMVSRAFNWSLGQRYECINGACMDTSDQTFMYMADIVRDPDVNFQLPRFDVGGALRGTC